MPAKYGVNYSISTEAARPISVQSTTPLGIIGTAEGYTYQKKVNGQNVSVTVEPLAEGLHFFGSVSKAKDAIENRPGTLKLAVDAVYDQAVETPVILSVFKEEDEKDDTKSNAVEAIEQMSKAEAVTGYRPNIIIAPGFSTDGDIASKMQAQAERLKATAVIDVNIDSESDKDNETQVLSAASTFGTNRVVLCYPEVLIWDSVKNESTSAPLSGYIAGMICRTDGEREYGFSDSHSNRVISGISGLKYPVDFVLGEDCEADRIRAAGVATVIRYEGFRVWGAETTDPDTIWKDLARVRTFDRIAEACQKGVLYAIDRKASQLYYAKRSVEELCRNLTGSQVLIGYEVSWSKEKNTDATVTEGKFYLDVKMQNNPIVKTIELDFAYVDSYSAKLLADINN